MPVYKDGNSGTWRAQFYYTDWTGKKHKKNKRGFKTKKEAQQFEAEYIRVAKADMDMKLSSFVEEQSKRRADKSGQSSSFHVESDGGQGASLRRAGGADYGSEAEQNRT